MDTQTYYVLVADDYFVEFRPGHPNLVGNPERGTLFQTPGTLLDAIHNYEPEIKYVSHIAKVEIGSGPTEEIK